MTTQPDEQDTEITEPLVLLKINQRWNSTMSAEQLYETTRGWWAANPRRMFRADHAAGVAHGVVRSVYRVGSWRERVPGDRCGPESATWLKFNPDFAYRNVKITNATVDDAVLLGVAYSRRLAEVGLLAATR